MKLKIDCQLEYRAAYETPFILLLRLHGGSVQFVLNETLVFNPATPVTEYTDLYGNYCQRFIAPEGKLTIKTSALVETAEGVLVDEGANFTLIQHLPNEALLYLLPSRFCESDKLNALAWDIVGSVTVGYQMVEAIRQWVKSKIQYEYNRSSSSTSALDTLSAGHGVCRDVSHLAIALCRSLNIPARFVVGYLYELKPMDLHAWFEAFLEGQWHPFDATQAVTTGGRVILAYGRDAADVATATYFGEVALENMYVAVEKVI